MRPLTLFEKIWNQHCVLTEEGESLLYVDRALVAEGACHAFVMLEERRDPVFRPDQVFAFADHYVPTTSRAKGLEGIAVPEIRNMVANLEKRARKNGLPLFGLDDPRQGIQHIVPPEQGITQPGLLIVGCDSHTSTHGAFGCFAFGVGASEMAHIMATQTIWQRKSKTMRIAVEGELGFAVSAKDIILTVIGTIGAAGGTGHVLEYAGSAIRSLSMDARMTVCNMSIEAGAGAGMVACDDITLAYMEGRPYAPRGSAWRQAVDFWKTMHSDADAPFDREVAIDAGSIAPMVTWGTNPEHVLPITGKVPDPDAVADEKKRAEILASLDYMDLKPGTTLSEIGVDHVFIGSCTNSRIQDLRAAAQVARLGRAKVPAWIVPGSQVVKRQGEQEGLDRVFENAGFEWRNSGCSLCTAINGDQLQPGQRCASTSNRSYRGRQGPGVRTHLMSPAMAAAAAITGRLTDVRELLHRS
jgi:3-isopropylmalate/(R)-2-methylmalate dehydratase large subunit